MHSAKSARLARAIGAVVLALCALVRPALAQTSGSVTGTVLDTTGGVLPGATITATHLPTGTRYEAVSDANGQFEMPSVRVGGPYTVTARLSGFQDVTEDEIFVNLGTAALVRFQLRVQSVSETVTVFAQANPIINPDRTGAGSTLYRETMESLPTLGRGINDFARLNPNFQTDAGRGGLVVAGKNYRYNAIQIDGAV
ncbi:MAG: carboxypeptidase-like regulatory domain-containing protein, partial [Vicinamibacterales bacterium]